MKLDIMVEPAPTIDQIELVKILALTLMVRANRPATARQSARARCRL
ncbi:MAG: hypothetical protein AB7S71_02225 [Dongiaceae bacterium]